MVEVGYTQLPCIMGGFTATDKVCFFQPIGAMAGSGSKVDMKVVLLGKEYVGKTCLVQRYLHEKFSVDSPYQSVSYQSCPI